MKELTVEIFAVGKWNGIKVTQMMLSDLANNFTRLSAIVDVPLKFGHNDEQPLTDGQPALGWVSKVWVEGEKLFALFTDIPEIVFESIKSKQFKNVSIEALFDVEHKGVEYGTVLTAVALLGVDMPAVNTLADLQTYMTANNLAFSAHATFSKQPHISETSTMMTEKEQAEFAAMKAQVDAQTNLIAENATVSAKFTAQAATDKAEIDALKAANLATAFATAKKEIETDLETLVGKSIITPGQRDVMLKDFSADTKEHIKFSINVLKQGVSASPGTEFTAGQGGGEQEKAGVSASDRVMQEVAKLQTANSALSTADAIKSVFSTNSKLAAEYVNENDKVT